MSYFEINNLSIAKIGKTILQDLNLKLEQGEFGTILGPSGVGKSTLISSIAGFNHLNTGTISLNNRQISGANYTLVPEKRDIGLIAQYDDLFPHLTVRSNLQFGLKNKKELEFVNELVEIFQISHLLDEKPKKLSGGEKKRVAFIRALAPKPKLLLMDEPFNGLESKLVKEIQLKIKPVLRRLKTTALLITHHINDALMLTDKLGLMRNGHIEQWGSVNELRDHPINSYVAEYLWGYKSVHCKLDAGVWKCTFGDFSPIRQNPTSEVQNSQTQDATMAKVLISPDKLSVVDCEEGLCATVSELNYQDTHITCTAVLNDTKEELNIHLPYSEQNTELEVGYSIHLNLKDRNLPLLS